MPEHVIPPGWYRIGVDDKIQKGDRFWDGEHWLSCESSIGGTPRDEFTSETVIRKGVTIPAPDREWLNPWD